MKLKELLQVCNAQELGELYTFWNGQETRQPGGDLGAALERYMSDTSQVRQRLRFLSTRLVDLLRFFLGRRQYEANLEHVRRSQTFSFMSPHEVEAAVRALVKRGFLFPVHRMTKKPDRFTVPRELGEVLRGELEDLDLALPDAFSLRRALVAQGKAGADLDLDELCRPEAVRARAAALDAEVGPIYQRALEQGAGLMSRSVLLRNCPQKDFPRHRVKEALEKGHLGTMRQLALGEYGINHFDDVVILFEDVLWAEMDARRTTPGAAGLTVRSLGVDLLSDLAQVLGRLSREKVRLTQSGSVYRTAARKIEAELILGTKAQFEPDQLFEFVFHVALERHLVRRTGDRYLQLTSKGRTWPRLSVAFKLRELLQGVQDDLQQHFHRPRLQQLCLEVLQELDLDRWYDFPLLVGIVRHRYLSRLDDVGIREAYQSRYQYSSEAHMRDLPQLTHMVANFLSYHLHLLGLVDIAHQEGRPALLRLSPLAGKALDLEDRDGPAEQGPRLLVNPDFEVLLFPDGDCYELIQRLDRFTERVSTEGAYRFRLTARSLERAIATGMSQAEILETLSENSESELPQNVVYSIRDAAEKVRFVQIQRAILVSARHKEVIDTLLKHSAIRKAVLERVGPRLLALKGDADLEEILPQLEADGVFLEGEGSSPGNGTDLGNGDGNGNGGGADPGGSPTPASS